MADEKDAGAPGEVGEPKSSRAAEKKPAKARKPKKNRHGGRREGAGRKKKGEIIRLAAENLDPDSLGGIDIQSSSLMPKEILVVSARLTFAAAMKDAHTGAINLALMRESATFARMAAPYYHPHLSWQMMSGPRPGNAPPIEEKRVGNGAVIAMPNNGRRLVAIEKKESAA